ncbi:MAG: POT family MFS transporter [Verrucomicrobia bacterium]|nr:POT family MFS transporter [Verrucomicrobiota bacterium]
MSEEEAISTDAGATKSGAARVDRMPRSVPFIVGNEAAERFSYYGMRSILTLYMAEVLMMGDKKAVEVMHLFIAAVYFMPLLGGWIADRWWGRYWTILTISLFYCLGHGVLAIFEGSQAWLYVGLALIAIGSGGIKPCVSAFVGDQFGPEREHLLPKVYGMFYWAINFGSFFAFLIIPWVKERAGYSWAFAIPGIAMGLATLIFWLGTPAYVRKPPARQTKQAGFFKVLWHAWKRRAARRPGSSFLDAARDRFSPSEVGAVKAVLGILMLYAPLPVFWSLFDQTASTWVLQGAQMRPFDLWGFTIDAERIQSLNPLLVMILIPLFTGVLYPWLAKRGLNPTPLRRMTAGMFLAASSFAVCAWLEARVRAGAELSILWQALPYLILTSGEVLFSTTGLEFAFSQAPASMKSTIMSFWLLTVAVGDLLVAVITDLNKRLIGAEGAAQFLLYAGMMLGVTAIFAVLAAVYARLRARFVAEDSGLRPAA